MLLGGNDELQKFSLDFLLKLSKPTTDETDFTMATFQQTIPIINISSFVRSDDMTINRRQQQDIVLKQWDAAFREHGFAVIIGHGIPFRVVSDLETTMDEFFNMNQLEKNTFSHGSYGHRNGGYSALFTEAVAQSNEVGKKERSDPVESFAFTRSPHKFQVPTSASAAAAAAESTDVTHHLIECAATYYENMENLLQSLHRISARSLDLPHEDYLNNYYTFDNDETNDTTTMASSNTLKLAFYPFGAPSLEKTVEEKSSGAIRYGAHTDFQGLTILRPDRRDWSTPSAGGLEVFHADRDEWLPVLLPSPSDIRVLLANDDNNGDDDVNGADDFALVVNAGDLIQRWTNDRWISAVHRVSPGQAQVQSGNVAGNVDIDGWVATTGRKACVFFSGPRDDTVVSMLPMDSSNQVKETMTAKYPPIRSGDHLQLKLNKMQPNVG